MARHPPHRIDLDVPGFLRMLRRLPAQDADFGFGTIKSGAAYARKVLRAAAFLILQTPAAYTAFAAASEARGTDAGAMVRQMARGFGGLSKDALLAALRHWPCAAMLHVLADRLGGFTPVRTEARTRLLEVLRAHAILPPHPRVPHPDGAPE